MHHGGVPAAPADKQRGRLGELLEQFDDFSGQHPGQPGHDLRLGDAFVQGVGAVALAEYRTAPGDLMPGIRLRHALHFVEGDVHAPELLQKKLARAGCAFVARADSLNAAVVIEMVHHEGLPSRADDEPVGMAAREGMSHCLLDRFGLRYG